MPNGRKISVKNKIKFDSACVQKVDKKGLQPTLGFMQVGLDVVTSSISKSKLQFQQTNNYQLLYITSTIYFHSAVVVGRRSSNFQPA